MFLYLKQYQWHDDIKGSEGHSYSNITSKMSINSGLHRFPHQELAE